MSGTLTNNYGIGDVNFDNLMLTVDAQRTGFHAVTLTEFDTSVVPQIAAGSKIEMGGSLFEFDSNENISGSPSDGEVYIYLSETKGTASGATTDTTGYAIGTTTITLASAGTGTIIVGDRVTFGSDTVKYQVTAGDADVSNGGTITIASPGLLTAIPASATAITVYAGAADANFTNTAPTWSDDKQGWYGTGGSANYRYLNYKMTKTGSNYTNKGFLLLPKTTDFLINENGDTVCNDITCNDISGVDAVLSGTLDIAGMLSQSLASSGYIDIGGFTIQWGNANFNSDTSKNVSFGRTLTNIYVATLGPRGGPSAQSYYISSLSTSSITITSTVLTSDDCFFIVLGTP